MRIAGADEALEHLAAWARRERWREPCQRALAAHFETICRAAGMDEKELAEEIGEEHYEIAQACAFEDFLAGGVGWRGRNVIDDYIDQRGWKEAIGGRDYLRALRASLMSLYEVVEVRPGAGLVLRDLIRDGEPLEVDERLGSESLVRWDRIGARVLRIGSECCLSGAVLQFRPEAAEVVLRIFRRAPERAMAELVAQGPELTEEYRRMIDKLLGDTTITLEAGARVFTTIWLADALKRLKAPPPVLSNFDGERIVWSKVMFKIADQTRRAEISDRLDRAAALGREQGDSWCWLKGEDEATGARSASGIVIGGWGENGRHILGHVELGSGHLTLETNSVERAERGKEMLKTLLGDLVGEALTSTQSMERALEEHRQRRRGKPETEGTSGVPPEEEKRILGQLFDRHYHWLLDQPVPALGNVAPRAAASGAEGRAKLVGWLKYLENGEARRARERSGECYDFTWMWRELGVLDARR